MQSMLRRENRYIGVTLLVLAIAAVALGLARDGTEFLPTMLPEVAGFAIGGLITAFVLERLQTRSQNAMWQLTVQSVRSAFVVTLEAALVDFEKLYACVGRHLVYEHSGKKTSSAEEVAQAFRQAQDAANWLKQHAFQSAKGENSSDPALTSWQHDIAGILRTHSPADSISHLDTKLWRLNTLPLANVPPSPSLDLALYDVRREAQAWHGMARGIDADLLARLAAPKLDGDVPGFDHEVWFLGMELDAASRLLAALAALATSVEALGTAR